jgi:hypothetical protein
MFNFQKVMLVGMMKKMTTGILRLEDMVINNKFNRSI